MKRAWILALSLACAAPALADVVHLKDGRKIEGDVVEQTDAKVVVKTKIGTAEFTRAEVVKIEEKATPEAEFEKRKAEAKGDGGKLFELYLWAKQNGLTKQANATLRDVVKADPDHENARKLLGHVRHGDKWVTEKEREKLEKQDERKANEAKGLVEHKGEWMTPEEKETRIHEERGEVLVDGQWVNKAEAERARKAAADREQIAERKARGEFLVEGEWVPKDRAEAYYRDIQHPYEAEGEHVRLFTNKGIDVADAYLVTAEAAYRKAKEFFGTEPDGGRKVIVFVCAGIDDYKKLGAQWGDAKSSAFSAFCSPWLPKNDANLDMASVTMYYQTQQNTELFITHAVVEQFARRLLGVSASDAPPPWFIDGVASYLERWQSPKLFSWARDNLIRAGGLSSFKTFFKSYQHQEQQIHQGGATIAFLRSPDTKPAVKEAFDAALKAFLGRAKMQKPFKELEKVLVEHEDEFKDFFESK